MLEKARDLSGMLKSFRHDPLKEEELDEFFYAHTMAIRTGDAYSSPLEQLYKDCVMPSTSNAHLFMGHMGCGKSTELKNLKRKFEESGHWVYIIDTLNETEPNIITYWDILILITEGLFKIAEKYSISIPEKPQEEIYKILYSNEESITTKAESADIDINSGVKIKTPSLFAVLEMFSAVKSGLKYSKETRTNITTIMPRRASEWLMHTKEVSHYITEKCGEKQPIIILENLDKLPVPGKIFEIMDYSVLSQMPFPVIYTFPINQNYSTNFASIEGRYVRHILPMIKVKNMDGSSNPKGIEVIKEIINLRADKGLFDENVMEKLIKKTGGSLRHLFQCITSAASRAEWREAGKIEMEDADRALAELSKDLTGRFTITDYTILSSIMETKAQIGDIDFFLKMVHSSIVLEYDNGERWRDLHPLVADFIQKHYKG